MAKFDATTRANGEVWVRYTCPGCDHEHSVPAKRWHWNQSIDKPTLSPSVRHFYKHPDGREVTTCHYFIVGGMIRFCGDCQHDLAGKVVELPEI